MIDQKILSIANDLKGVVSQYMDEANKNLSNLPEGETKQKLEALLKKARTGKMPFEKVQTELQNIVKDAGNN